MTYPEDNLTEVPLEVVLGLYFLMPVGTSRLCHNRP
jgi:hypothetical protein